MEKQTIMKKQFIPDVTPIQQKGRRVPIHLQERVDNEFNKLIDQKSVLKLEKCSDEQFISLIVITVKQDQTVRLATDSKKINKCKQRKLTKFTRKTPDAKYQYLTRQHRTNDKIRQK